jgi:ABC-type sugar transport system ATPase subunit
VSLAVRAGEIVGVAGLVGSGRTELLETIIGIRKAGGGRLLVGGRQITLGSPRRALAAGLALVPEDRHRQGLNLVTCIRENIAMGTWRLATAQRARERALSTQAVRQLRIRTTGIEAPVRSLSGGNQQKVVVARCLTRRPGALLLDEPTRGIDVGAKEEVFQLVGEMVGEGMGILMVSSEMVELLGLCDRIIVMHERRVVGELARGEATEERIALLSAGGGRALVA